MKVRGLLFDLGGTLFSYTGRRRMGSAIGEAVAGLGIEAEPVAFVDVVADAYGWADLVVCRAGALTVSELAVAGVASVLVPYPFAVDDHQTRNGRHLADAHAAVLIDQSELDAPRLGSLLAEFHGARDRLLAMAMAARGLGIPTATRQVCQCCMELVHV